MKASRLIARSAASLLAGILLIPAGASADAGTWAAAEFRVAGHEVEIDASAPFVWVGPGGVSTSLRTMSYVSVHWRRNDNRGDPWFESAWGQVPVDIDPATRRLRLRGTLPEFFHDGYVTIDVTVEGSPQPWTTSAVYTPSEYGIRAGGSAAVGVTFWGSATGSVTSSLGTLRDATGVGSWGAYAGVYRSVGV